MARAKTEYIVIHCSQTRPSQDIGVEEIDRWHRQRGWFVDMQELLEEMGKKKEEEMMMRCRLMSKIIIT